MAVKSFITLAKDASLITPATPTGDQGPYGWAQ
jgi:hypothetical protein